MSLSYAILDVFTSKKFVGNPVAIVHVPSNAILTQTQKQLIAREFNLSESVFLHERTEAELQNGDVRIDIFTVVAEVPFAGHPTVGVSNYMLRYLQDQTAFQNVRALQAKAGRIPVDLTLDGMGVQLKLAHNVRIHKDPFKGQPFAQYPVVSIVKGMTFILAKTDGLAELAKPTQSFLGSENTYTSQEYLDEGWREGLIASYYYVVQGLDENGARTVRTRMFGSREDPATGSAASALTSYLALSYEGDRVRKYHIIQGVEMGRESHIHIQITLTEDSKSVEEVLLSGTAVKVIEGKIDVPENEDVA